MSSPATSGPAGAALSAAPGEARVTGTLFKLHALLWWRELKGNAAKIFTLIVLGIYLVLGLVGAVLPMIAAASGVLDPELIPLFTGGGTLAYVLGMWYFGDTDRHLNPGILGTLPLTSRQVAPRARGLGGIKDLRAGVRYLLRRHGARPYYHPARHRLGRGRDPGAGDGAAWAGD